MSDEFRRIRRLPPCVFAGDGRVQIALVENTQRLRQAARSIRGLSGDPLPLTPSRKGRGNAELAWVAA